MPRVLDTSYIMSEKYISSFPSVSRLRLIRRSHNYSLLSWQVYSASPYLCYISHFIAANMPHRMHNNISAFDLIRIVVEVSYRAMPYICLKFYTPYHFAFDNYRPHCLYFLQVIFSSLRADGDMVTELALRYWHFKTFSLGAVHSSVMIDFRLILAFTHFSISRRSSLD